MCHTSPPQEGEWFSAKDPMGGAQVLLRGAEDASGILVGLREKSGRPPEGVGKEQPVEELEQAPLTPPSWG